MYQNKTNCLSSLVGIRTGCKVPIEAPFYIEDIEGLDVEKLSKLAKASEGRGENLANYIVGSAAREMMGDLELFLNNGFSMKNIVGNTCSSCTILPTYTSGTGIIIKTVSPSAYQVLNITKLVILANATGVKELTIDDGINPQKFNVTLQAGVKMPVNLDYKTNERSAKVYFTDATIGLGQISCPTTSSCGCGGSSASQSPISISGLRAGAENSVQYGFIACAGVSCSYDSLVCSLINYAPNIFGLALLFKSGEKYNLVKNQTERNNDKASFEDDSQPELQRNFGQLYWAKINGTKNSQGIKHIINSFLKTKANDKCVVCNSKFYTASVTG